MGGGYHRYFRLEGRPGYFSLIVVQNICLPVSLVSYDH